MIKKISPIWIVILAATILVLVWFKNGNIMGTGESGLPFYDFEIQYKSVETAWFKYGLGGPSNVNFASSPTYFVLWQLQKIGIPNFLMQAVFFWICLVLAGFSILRLTKEFFPNIKDKYLVLGVFFYWFNPISLVNVWNRFLNNYFMFFAFLPLSLYLFIKGIKTKNFYYAYLFAISTTLFSYVHSSMAFNVLLWLTIFYAVLFYTIVLKNKKEKLFVVIYFLVYFFLWLIINLWWIILVAGYISSQTFSEVTNNFFTNAGNYSSFTDLSLKLGRFTELFSFKHGSFYWNNELIWFGVYNFTVVKLLSFFISLVILIGIIAGRKKSAVLFFSLFFITVLFLIKGNNYPFGEITSWLFLKFPAFQLFRNPFEKFGFLLVLSAAPLLVFALNTLEKYKWKFNFFYWFSWFIIVAVWGFPFWTGLVFTNNFPPLNKPDVKYEVIVPPEYKSASDWLKSQNGDFKLVVLPIYQEGITYDWEKGFSGIELSNQLLPRTSVSFDTTVPFYHDIAENIQNAFFENEKFYPVMNALNAKYILVRQDINWKERGMMDPEVVLKALKEKENQGEFKHVITFGKLSFWENQYYKKGEISVSQTKKVIAGKPKIDDLISLGNGEVLISENTEKSINSGVENLIKIYPQNRIVLTEFNEDRYAPQYVFPHVSIYPNSKYYFLILLKEKIQELFVEDDKKIEFKLLILGKRIKETTLDLSEKDDQFLFPKEKNDQFLLPTLDRYRKTLAEYAQFYKTYQSSLPVQQKEELQLEQAEIFYKHLLHFKDLEELYGGKAETLIKIREYEQNLKKVISDLDIYPENELAVVQTFPLLTRLIYKYSIPRAGDYNLLIKDQQLLKNFDIKTTEVNIQINNQLKTVIPEWTKEGNLLLGNHTFIEGENEISFNKWIAKNLIDSEESFDMQVIHGQTSKSFPIKNFITGKKYNISFDYFIKRGNGPSVLLFADNSPVQESILLPEPADKEATVQVDVRPDYYDFDKKHYGFTTGSLNGATTAELVFKLKPWNSCINIFSAGQYWCEDRKTVVIYDRQSDLNISNLSVAEEFTEIPFLEKKQPARSSLKLPEISYKKITQTKYQVEVKNAKDSYFLILSQLNDPGWTLKTDSGEKIGQGSFVVNMFGNGWLIDKQGDYKLVLEYQPQKKLESGIKISATAFIVILILLSFKLLRPYINK